MSEVRSPVAPSTHNVTEKKSAVALTGGVDVTQGPGSGVLAANDAKVPTTNCKFAMFQVKTCNSRLPVTPLLRIQYSTDSVQWHL